MAFGSLWVQEYTKKIRWNKQFKWGRAWFKVAIANCFRDSCEKSYFGIHQGPNGRILAYKWNMLLYNHIK